jgi:translation initiation factor 4A
MDQNECKTTDNSNTGATLGTTIASGEAIKEIQNWDELEIQTDILRGIYAYGFDKPSFIQQRAILPIISGNDVIAQAQSGTGKTGAFTISALNAIDLKIPHTQVVIIAPTHELALQIANVNRSIGVMMEGLIVKTLIGGTPVNDDIQEITKTPPHIVVGTTGRILDMIQRRHLNVDQVKLFILDEADEMLSRGFKTKIQDIFEYFNNEIQVAIFSATLPAEILELTQRFMRNPVKITLDAEKLSLDGISQFYVAVANDNMKYDTLKDLFSYISVSQSIIYCDSIDRVIKLYGAMLDEGFPVCCMHGDMGHAERKEIFQKFQKGAFRVLISTNITSRGIDVQQVSVVINFDIPKCPHNYLHRIGRSGRWGRKGLAINFVTKRDVHLMRGIEKHYKKEIMELPNQNELKNYI